MASCAAKGCKNYRRKSKGVTFFSLPKHPSLAAEWLQRINKDRLPKHICVCEKHFSDKQFNNSTEMRNKFLVECGQKRKARKLIPNAVPDIFLQNEKESNTKNVVLDVLKDTPQLNENTPQIVPSQLNLLQESNFNFQEYPSQVEFKMKVHYEIEETLNAYSELPNDQEDSYFFHSPKMSIETAKSPSISHSLQSIKSRSMLNSNEESINRNNTNNNTSSKDSSLHSYHMWLKEKQLREEEELQDKEKNGNVKEEDDEDENGDDNFQVDAVLERGPSPPEQENSSYEWSYEEQFKQLYEIDDDSERKTFLDEYFEFMKSRGTPVSRIPIMAKQILDLFQLYNLVVKHGGLVQVIRNKLWSKITKGLNLPTSITSAAFTLRTQYLKYLYPYECTMHNFSTPKELQAAIDSNRRDRFSTLYHTEPSMTPSRDDRYGGFPLNGCDYPVAPRHHMGHPGLTSSQVDMRYGLKRPGDPMYPKSYDKYGGDNPKVIVLQDGTPSMADRMGGKISPPSSYHSRSRSPLRDSDMRSMADIDTSRMRGHHFNYGKGDWEGDARHVMGEDRRRLMDDVRGRNGASICKDKNCNGIDCKYTRPDFHRHRSHDPMSVCSCSYCKDYRAYSPTRRELPPRHHMDGASAANGGMRGTSGNQTPPINGSSGRPNGSISSTPPSHHNKENEEQDSSGDHKKMTTLKMKLPDIRKGGNAIQISLEVSGVLYEGVISASTPIINCEHSVEEDKREGTPVSSHS